MFQTILETIKVKQKVRETHTEMQTDYVQGTEGARHTLSEGDVNTNDTNRLTRETQR